MKNVYDIHIHASPSIFERWGDARQTAAACQKAGYAGIVLKAHHGSTVEIANIVNQQYDMDVFGGVVLNYFVGGLNPYAVDACCALGGKIVWLPTIHADAHKPLGRFDFQEPSTTKFPDKGIRILSKKGLTDAMYEILDILHGKNVVLATGHVSAKEAVTLVREVKQRGYDIRILINHVLFYTPDMDENDIETLKDPGVWFEISHLTQKIHAASMDRLTRMITRHPDANWVMVSDAGQKGNPSPQALRQFRDQLTSRHISDQTIEKMMVHNPRRLFY
jgi:hypothetical protein